MSTNNSIVVGPPPYQSPFTSGQNGMLTPAWSTWIRQLYERIGGASSPSNAGIVSDITTLQNQVATLQTQVGTLNTETATLINEVNGLLVGRQL